MPVTLTKPAPAGRTAAVSAPPPLQDARPAPAATAAGSSPPALVTLARILAREAARDFLRGRSAHTRARAGLWLMLVWGAMAALLWVLVRS